MPAAKKGFGVGNLRFWFLILFLFGDRLPLCSASCRKSGKWFCVWKQGLQIIVICRELNPRPLLLEKEGEKEIEKQ